MSMRMNEKYMNVQIQWNPSFSNTLGCLGYMKASNENINI